MFSNIFKKIMPPQNNNIDSEKKRGVFLVTILTIYGLIGLLRLAGLISSSISSDIATNGPTWGFQFNAFILLVAVLGLYYIINWKKWAVYVYVAGTTLLILVDFFLFNPRPGMLVIFEAFVLLGLFIWAVCRKWKYFL